MQPLIGSDQMTRATLVCVRSAQRRWNGTSVSSRLKILRSLRHDIARNARDLAAAVPLHRESQLSRTVADTLCSEVFPLAEACRFLEREAVGLLRPVRQPSRLRPIWLSGVDVETQREPLGIVLIIGPGNYPLFIPGVQALQALVAGNAVLWKPAPGCSSPALKLQSMLTAAGLERDLFTVLDESQETAQRFIAAGVDKVILTGSAETGRAIMHSLAENLTPSVMELSGCDAVFVLKEADPARVVDALVFGLRFNGSATCMAPRRLILSRSIGAQLVPRLTEALRHVAPVAVTSATRRSLDEFIKEASLFGAKTLLNGLRSSSLMSNEVGPTLIDDAAPILAVTKADLFAPVLTVLYAEGDEEALSLNEHCPFALSAAVFGPRHKAEKFANRLHVGTVLINDVIVSSADPRVSFGGVGRSGFGVTRGAAGLLEMTLVKNVVVQRSRSRRFFQPLSRGHFDLLTELLFILHGTGWRKRITAFFKLAGKARRLSK